MSEFVASNGYRIDVGAVYNRAGSIRHYLGKYTLEALREFFQHERDEELGRWRWPENRDYVVYADGDGDVVVVDERKGRASSLIARNDLKMRDPGHNYTKAARAYFDAHPEPKPWHDAKPGDIWALSIEGEESYAVHATAGFFGEVVFKTITGRNVNMRSSVITDARKIWPEPS